jgi:hypothetical protein
VAFDNAGVPIPGIIPGWTFTGGDGGVGEELCLGVGCTVFGDGFPGDSGTEGGGNPGNEMILSTVDGKAYQTSLTSMPASHFPATQKLLLTFDVHNIFTPTGMAQLTARLYYVDGGGVRQTIGSPIVVGPLDGFQTVTHEFVGGSAALTPALTRPIGVSFDTTSRELDNTVTDSWAGVDNVVLEIASTLAGDFNGDGSVTLADYTILKNNIEEAHDFLSDGDIIRNGFVDLNDFRAWKSLPSVINSGVLAQIAAIPEPSSLMLILASTIAGAFSRRRLGISDRACAWLLAIVGGIVISLNGGTASAAVLAYDPFLVGPSPAAGEYTATNLSTAPGVGQNPTIGPTPFFSGAWDITDAGVNFGVVQTQGLSFLGAPAAGGSVIATGSTRVARRLTNPWTATTTGTYFISFLANFGGVGVSPTSTSSNDVGHRNIEFFPEGAFATEAGGSSFRVGYSTYNGTFAGRVPAAAPLIGGPFGQELILDGGPASFAEDNGSTHLIVFKFELSATAASDSLSIYLDPTGNEEPIIPAAIFPGRDITLGSLGVAQFGGTGTLIAFDELRVADVYEDALPDFPRKGNTNPGTGPGQDDLVDILDYNAIITHMNLTGQSTANGDVTGDGRVDLRDLRVWRDNRTDLAPLVANVSVPEPASAALMAMALLPLLGRGRRS